MSWINYHTHSDYCDGQGKPEAFIQAAIHRNMPSLGFSSHAPVAFTSTCHMRPEKLQPYLKELDDLKISYNRVIKLYTGLEIDYIPGVTGPENFRDLQLDYSIGSVHYVGQFKHGDFCSIEETRERFEQGLEQIFNNDIEKLVSTYYGNVISMIKEDPPDIIGHLDIIKKLNGHNRYFDENSSWYQQLVTEVVQVIGNSSCLVEVNTRGYYKSLTREIYPSRWILEKCLQNNIPIVLSSDAHRPEELDRGLADAAADLVTIGYRQVQVFNGNAWLGVQLNYNGMATKRKPLV